MFRFALVGLCVAACGDNVIDKVEACRLATATSAATIEDRRVIGLAAPYAPDLGLAARDSELAGSIAARRAAAWQIVERVVQPVPLGDPSLASQFGGTQPTIPAWHTWYARDDFERVFKTLYRDLGPDGRAARAAIDGDAGLQANAIALDQDPAWPEQRYLDYLAAIATSEQANGVGGASRVGYSPGAMRHLIESYAKQYACRTSPDPIRFEAEPVRPPRTVTQTDRADVDGCEFRVLGPFQAGHGSVRVTSRGDGDIDLYVRRGAPATPDRFDCRSSGDSSDERCTTDGDGAVFVSLFGAEPGHAEIEIEYVTEDVRDPTCLDGEMPRDAVVVKADWRRQFATETLPVYDTDAASLRARLAGDARWIADGTADPPAADIYTVVLPSGARFRMPALHIMSKELDHWVWITLWYSPQPDGDFGADRPAALAGPWRNYKMCVAIDYVELDGDPRGGANDGSLGDALAAVHGGVGGPTWCSNPYLEQGAGNAATNCIGCHQHGGTTLAPERILADEPHRGVTRTRNNFFTDYLWVVKGGGGENLSSVIQAEVEFWDANDKPRHP